ncbi:MAG: hypothetical protein ACF8XB_14730 [Planctomycetota bacterium JB042]
MRIVHRSAALLLALPLAAPPVSAEVVGRATLQIRGEPGYDASSISRLLTDGAYLGSVMPGMMPAHAFGGDEIPDDVTLLASEPAGMEILTLELTGRDDGAVRAHLAALLKNLTSIVPSRRADALQAVKTSEEALDLATSEYERMRGRLSGFVEKNGAVEPTQWLNTLRASLQKRAAELERLDLEVASGRALRDYLVETIATTPKVIEDEPGAEGIEQAESELRFLRAMVGDLLEKRTETHADVVKARQSVEQAEAKLKALKSSPVQRQQTNPRRVQLERELFEIERDLALNESRRREMKAYVDDLRDDAKRLALVESDWRDLREQVQMAEARLFGARNQLDQAKQQARQALASEWATVIAGPTYAAR